jgi:hypothetical protein
MNVFVPRWEVICCFDCGRHNSSRYSHDESDWVSGRPYNKTHEWYCIYCKGALGYQNISVDNESVAIIEEENEWGEFLDRPYWNWLQCHECGHKYEYTVHINLRNGVKKPICPECGGRGFWMAQWADKSIFVIEEEEEKKVNSNV